MSAGSMRYRYLVLGLLTQQPMTGYDIKRFLKNLGWLVGNTSFGSLYPTLHALLKDNLATVEVFSQQDKPPRKVYSITEAGKQALHKWAGQPTVAPVSLKTFVMRLTLASNIPLDALIAHLEQRRAQVVEHVDALRETVRPLDTEQDWSQQLALDYGLALADAELTWLDNTLSRLSQLFPIEVAQGN